ncbi:hypothetical protein ACQP3F_31095, partial [Escherichia coli]
FSEITSEPQIPSTSPLLGSYKAVWQCFLSCFAFCLLAFQEMLVISILMAQRKLKENVHFYSRK